MEEEALAWETDQHLLSWNVAGEHRLSLGYATHSLEDYQGLVPVVLDVMDELLKDCAVFTWLKTPLLQVSSTKSFWFRRNAPKRVLPNLAAQYASEKKAETFFDGDCEIIVQTKGANRALMERFYQIPNCATAFDHSVYGFYTPPEIDPQGPYENAHFSVVHPLANYVISYRGFHVELNVSINPAAVSEADVMERIQRVCEKHSKKII
ncbi:hypothetical protein [Oscillibacter sp.]|uniref:hypothetical protein n=1 Tax=Oscillibacter sp. TaxID=1945593 RepID=UPI00289B54E1|nr:hypothetical protein [Oscillibacter sp.]